MNERENNRITLSGFKNMGTSFTEQTTQKHLKEVAMLFFPIQTHCGKFFCNMYKFDEFITLRLKGWLGPSYKPEGSS